MPLLEAAGIKKIFGKLTALSELKRQLEKRHE